MITYSHGGDVYSRRVEHDFSANINPLGLPDEVLSEVSQSLWHCDNYPDPHCRELIRAISEREWFPSGKIVCGNGAADLIYRIVSALDPRRALVCAPTFSEYEKALTEHGCEVQRYYLKPGNGFKLTAEILGDITQDIDILFLCNPNNPTGTTIPQKLLKRIIDRCGSTGTFLVIDECFLDFVKVGSELSAKPLLNDNSAVLKAFTKIFAMPGLRLGYALFGSEKFAEKVAGKGQAWSVSTPAQAAGIAALKMEGYVEKTVELIRTEREFLTSGLRSMGLEVIPSEANFILFRCGKPLDEILLERGTAIRNCENYHGLERGWFRTAVRLHEENALLLAAIREALNGCG